MTYILPSGEVIDETRREFYDRHVFYDGRYLGVELLTGILEDYSRGRSEPTSCPSIFMKAGGQTRRRRQRFPCRRRR